MKRSRPNAKPNRGAVKKNKNKNTKNRKLSQTGGGPGELLLSISPRDTGDSEFYAMAVHPTQPLVAVGGDGGSVGLLHINFIPGQHPSKKYIANDRASNSVSCLAFHPVHPLLACASFDEVVLYRTDNVDDMLRRYDETTSVVYDEDEYIPSRIETATTLTRAAVVLKKSTDPEKFEQFTQVAFHPTELLMVCNYHNLSPGTSSDPTIKLFRISPDYASVTLLSSASIRGQGIDDSKLDFSSDGNFIVYTYTQNSSIRLWGVREGRLSEGSLFSNLDVVAFNSREPGIIHSGYFHGYGGVNRWELSMATRIALGGPGQWPFEVTRVELRGASTVRGRQQQPVIHRSPIKSIAFHPSGDVIITGAQGGDSKMCEYDADTGIYTPIVQLGAANAQPVQSIAVNVNFIVVCREAGIDIYNYGWSRGKRIRRSIREIAVAAIPPLVLPQTVFGVSSEDLIRAQVRVAQNVQEYQSMCLSADKTRDECNQARCSVCLDEFLTRGQLAQPVFFHETIFIRDGIVTRKWTCPLHLDDMDGLVKRGTLAACPYCRKKMDISRTQLDGVLEMYRYHQKLLADHAAISAPASRIGRVFKGHLTRKSSPGKAVANQIKGIYASKIGSAFRGHLTRKSSPGQAVAKQVARKREYMKSRKAFSQEYRKRKVDAVLAIAKFTGHSPDGLGAVFEEQLSRSGGDFDEAVRTTTELLFAKSRQQSLADPARARLASESQRHREEFFAAAAARAAAASRISEGLESENGSP